MVVNGPSSHCCVVARGVQHGCTGVSLPGRVWIEGRKCARRVSRAAVESRAPVGDAGFGQPQESVAVEGNRGPTPKNAGAFASGSV